MLFLAGVPGALKRLKDRLVPSGTTETLTDARMLKLDNLDATVASRAPSSTALSTATWTGTKAGYLDAAISSVKMKGQVNMVRDTAVTSTDVGSLALLDFLGAKYDAPATMGAGTYYELLSVTAAGWLYVVVTGRNSGFSSGTLSTRITIDGDVWDVITDTVSTTLGQGHVAHGAMSGSVIMPIATRFDTSLKVEIASSVAQSSSSKAASRILYSLDT